MLYYKATYITLHVYEKINQIITNYRKGKETAHIRSSNTLLNHCVVERFENNNT